MTDYPALIAEALAYGGNTHSVQDVMQQIVTGRAMGWWGERSVVVTQEIAYPNFRAVRIWLAAGDLDELLGMEPRIVEYARNRGAKRVEFGGGRPGWERVMRGYKRLSAVGVKEI